jgi:hypothetical protein
VLRQGRLAAPAYEVSSASRRSLKTCEPSLAKRLDAAIEG